MFVRVVPFFALFFVCTLAAAEPRDETSSPPQPPDGKVGWEAHSARCTIPPNKNVVGSGYLRDGVLGTLDAYGSVSINGTVVVIAEVSVSAILPFIGRVPTSADIYVRESETRWAIYRMHDLVRERDRKKLGKYLLEKAGVTEDEYNMCKGAVDLEKVLFGRK
jgi:hypothetical protein